MIIHHLRNATFIIESKNRFILIDPMLSNKGELPAFSYFKHKMQKNPIVDLHDNSNDLLKKVTHCLITHSQKWGFEPLTHLDHLDQKGRDFLKNNKIPVTTLKSDCAYLKKHEIIIDSELEYWKEQNYLDGNIIAIPAKHGHGFWHNFMANGAGFVLSLPDEPSIYISGDTVLTDEVKKALNDFNPDITVVASGNASMDVGGDILMSMDEIVEFIKLSPNQVIANHLEALNHCPLTRETLKNELEKYNLLDKVFIPNDGESITIDNELMEKKGA